jgi:hypothetical protein
MLDNVPDLSKKKTVHGVGGDAVAVLAVGDSDHSFDG